jgi:rare lipoprotein A
MVMAAAAAAMWTAQATPSEARSHRHRHHHEIQQQSGWQNAQAAMPSSGRSFSGIASHYGAESGNRTASGQRFNPGAMTAAHRTLPFGTKLRVTHGSQSVIVTINDRGPFVRGRVLDLSTGAARAIGLSGLGHVTAEVVS